MSLSNLDGLDLDTVLGNLHVSQIANYRNLFLEISKYRCTEKK